MGNLLNEYLSNKGFLDTDLFKFKAVFCDSGQIIAGKKEDWLYTNFPFLDSEGNTKEIQILDILHNKISRYKSEGCNSAIFVPLFRLSGEFTGMSIRKLGVPSKHDSWFLPGTRKIDLLYNLVDAFEPAVKKNSILVTEGVYDTIALCKYGFTNSVALLGTNMSNIQFFQLMSMVDNIALCLDNDTAGNNAIDKIMAAHAGSVTFWRVDIDKDPDEFLKEHGATEFKKRIIKCTKN